MTKYPTTTLKIRIKKVAINAAKTDLLVIGMYANEGLRPQTVKSLDRLLKGRIAQAVDFGDFQGKVGTQLLVYGEKAMTAKRVLVLGLGEKKEVTLDTLRKASADAASKARALNVRTMSLALHQGLPRKLDRQEVARICAEGVCFGAYKYEEFITPKKESRLLSWVTDIIDEDRHTLQAMNAGMREGAIVGQANNLARTLCNRPGNIINPPTLAQEARGIARQSSRLSCTVLDKKKLQEKGMGGILAVGGGSASDPRFIVLRYKAGSHAAQKRPTVALVGKAVTFDSGGISIKPAANMDQMKFDKTGGIAVLATMQAIAALQLDINVLGVIPSAENMPSSTSYRPGDIVTTYSGKTVEILNTDAEGRMILCDGIAWAVENKADIIIDIATLTGACMVALGKHQAGAFSEEEDIIKDLQVAAQLSGEKIWHLPCGDEYAKDMKSKVADLKNCGPRWGGASTAAAFLRQFAENTPWAHLDIAGMDVYQASTNPNGASSSGFGVRLLTMYLKQLAGR